MLPSAPPAALGLALGLTAIAATAAAGPAPRPAPPPRLPATPYSWAPGEERVRREGFAAGIALGPAIFYGSGALDDIGGVGGGFALRLATTATERLLWVLDLEGGNFVSKVVDVTEPEMTETTLSSQSLVTLGGQLYLRDALWLAAGVGLSSFKRREPSGAVVEDLRRAGLAARAGMGYDLFRRGRFVIDGEVVVHLARFRGAALAHTTFGLGATFY